MNPTAELYQSLQTAYDQFNNRLFEGVLPPVIFTVQRKPGVMGYFAGDRWSDAGGSIVSEIAINPSYIASSRLIEVMQTLVHEMVHCWQHFHGNPGRKYYHNLEWARKMIDVGLMPSSTGEPGGKITGQFMGDYILKDGRFLKVFAELEIEQTLCLSWVDRRALPRLYEPVIAGPSPTENVATGGGSTHAAEESNTQQNLAVDTALCSEFSEVQAALHETPPTASHYSEGSRLLPGDLHILETPKRKTRSRYECPSCHVVVYGRPKLNLNCGDCNCRFDTD